MITLKSGKTIELNQAFNCDCLDFMRELPDKCIDLTVTSPPYDNLRTYNDSLEWNEDIWKAILKDLFRITKDGGVVVWVVGDATVKGSETGTSFKQALWSIECGFNLHDTMIWKKTNPLPQNHNRYEQQFEYMFVLSKGKPNTFNPLKIDTLNPGKEYSWDGVNDYGKKSAKRDREEISKTKDNKNKFNIWEFPVANSEYTNSAPFPTKLVRDHITTWSNKNDIVFDPFGGSFTTYVQAERENRNWIGCEKVKEYYDMGYLRYEQETKQQLFDF